MNIRVTMKPQQYYDGKAQFAKIREAPRCELQCPQHRPAKTRCKKCEYSQAFKFRRGVRGYDFVWINPQNEAFKANYIRDQATDKLVKVQIEFESPCTTEDPSEAYLEFKSWFEDLGAECQTIDANTPHPKAHLIARQLKRFDQVTANKRQVMETDSPLRPPATEGYIAAFVADRKKKRDALEADLRRRYGA